MRTLILCLLCLATSPAFAAEKKEEVCREGKSFLKEIYNCGQNKLAASYAQKCSDAALAAVKGAGAALAIQMEAARKSLGSGQAAGMNDARKRLETAVTAIGLQIVAMQKSASLIADYPSVMIDYPDGKDDETSAGCFSPAFNKIQDIVSRLDQEIVSAKEARLQAQAFLASVSTKSGEIQSFEDSPKTQRPEARGQQPQASRPKAPKGKGWNASDISGVKPKK